VDHFKINYFFLYAKTSKIRKPYILPTTGIAFFDHFQVIFGLPPPFWLIDSFRAVVGQRQAELAVQRGQLFSPQEALAIGLVFNITIHLLPPLKMDTNFWKLKFHMVIWFKALVNF
jgi:hypothetical protein